MIVGPVAVAELADGRERPVNRTATAADDDAYQDGDKLIKGWLGKGGRKLQDDVGDCRWKFRHSRLLQGWIRHHSHRQEPVHFCSLPNCFKKCKSRTKDCVLNEFNSAACEKWNYECLEGTRPAAAVLAVTSMATQNFCQACFGPKGSERWAVAAACRECMIGLQQNGVPIGALAISVAACCEKGPLADLDL